MLFFTDDAGHFITVTSWSQENIEYCGVKNNLLINYQKTKTVIFAKVPRAVSVNKLIA